MASRPNADHGLLIHEVSRSHAPQSVGLLWTSDQLVAETSIWQQTTPTRDKHPCPRRHSNPRSQQAVDPRLGPRGHWDWQLSPNTSSNFIAFSPFPPVLKRPDREAEHLALSSAEVKSAWSYTFTLSCALQAWCLVKKRDFTSHLLRLCEVACLFTYLSAYLSSIV